MADEETKTAGPEDLIPQTPGGIRAPKPAGERRPEGKTEAERKLEAEAAKLAEQEKDLENDPMKRYQKALELVNLTEKRAAEIVDAVLFEEDGYTEEFVIKGAKREIVGSFRTRQAPDSERLFGALAEQGLSPSQRDHRTAQYNLADSLHRYGDKTFEHKTDADHKTNLEWVRSLRAPVFTMLSQMLAQFDQRVLVACQKGAIENFFIPRGD